MGMVKEPQPVLLFTGIITQPAYKDRIIEMLKTHFGDIALSTEYIPFSHTDYYEKEMGKGLLRKWVAFRTLISPESISGVKIKTNKMEEQFSENGNRVFNIDPGYVSMQNMVLVTTKSYSHRIYLSQGIYGEVTLIYKKNKGFVPLEWTYPDYRENIALDFFNRTRAILKELLKKEK